MILANQKACEVLECTEKQIANRNWFNVCMRNRKEKTAIIYYYPPGIHFQVNCSVEIQKSGPLREFINRAACLAHGDNPAKWPKRTAYIFHIEEVIDKNVYPKA